MDTLLKEIREADLVITVNSRGEILIIKNRNGDYHKLIDMAGVLELLLPYQVAALQTPIKRWIVEARKYLNMKAFW